MNLKQLNHIKPPGPEAPQLNQVCSPLGTKFIPFLHLWTRQFLTSLSARKQMNLFQKSSVISLSPLNFTEFSRNTHTLSLNRKQ